MPTTEQLVKKITVGSDSRFIGAKYDYYGDEIKVADLATQAEMNTYFTKKDEIITIINQQLEKGDEKIDLEKNEGVVRKMTFINELSSNYRQEINEGANHFIIYFVATNAQDETKELPFIFNNDGNGTPLSKDQYATGAKIEILNNFAIITDRYGNPTVKRAKDAALTGIAFGEVPEGTSISLIIFEEPLTAEGFSATEQPQGSE